MLIIVSSWWLASQYGLAGAAAAWLAAIIVSQLFAAWFLRQLLPHPFSGLFGPLTSITISSLLGMWSALLLDHLLPGLLGIILATTTAIIISACTLWGLDRILHLGMLAGLLRVFPQLGALISIEATSR